MTEALSPQDWTDELDLLLDASARQVLRRFEGLAFVEWFADVVPILCPRFAESFQGNGESRRGAFRTLGRLLWNRMPLPDNHFRARPLPKPERNGPCPCGSGRKYKHCCMHVEGLDDPFAGVSLLKYVLAQYPRTQLKKLPIAGLDLEELAYIGGEWCREGRPANAEALLERIFEDVDVLDRRAEAAFDALANCYDELDRPKKKERLIERTLAARDAALRSAALHRRITILADRGERAEAWRLFAEAQRMDPDNPMLATLELTLLLAQKDHDRMRERGRFWIARLSRDRDRDYGQLIAHIRELIADPTGAALKYESVERPELLQLRQLLESLPAVDCHYDVERSAGEGCLVPSRALSELVAQWRQRAKVLKPDLTLLHTGDAKAWKRAAPGIPWLENHPLAWQSFDILDDLALAVGETELIAGEEALLAPLLERAYALLRLTLERAGASDCALPWGFAENRPALRLLVSLFHLREQQLRIGEALELGRWLLFTLNPNDNHGLREAMSRICLDLGDPQGALDLCDRYPGDDLVATMFNRALALFMLARHAEAQTALREASQLRPKVLPMLLASNPKPVRSEGDFMRIGGNEEAWLYREQQLALWEKSGALTWARGHRKA